MTAIPELADHLRRVLAGEAFTARVCYCGIVFETRYLPLHDARGEVSEAIGVAVDITTQAQSEAALRCAEFGLSQLEREVLALLARADLPAYREIGAALFVSRETVRTHLRAIARKLGVAERRADVVAAAYARGLVPPPPDLTAFEPSSLLESCLGICPFAPTHPSLGREFLRAGDRTSPGFHTTCY